MNTLYKYAAAFVALLSSIAGLFFYGKSAGKNEEKSKQSEDFVESINEFNEIEDAINAEVNALDEAGTDAALSDNGWMHNDNK